MVFYAPVLVSSFCSLRDSKEDKGSAWKADPLGLHRQKPLLLGAAVGPCDDAD